jgi:hypothetical protein
MGVNLEIKDLTFALEHQISIFILLLAKAIELLVGPAIASWVLTLLFY